MSETTKQVQGVVLPTEKLPPLSQSPGILIIFSKPKVGKTVLCADLEDSLLLDVEEGAKFVEARRVDASSIAKIYGVRAAIQQKIKDENKYPYQYLVVDTVTKLEELCIDYAEFLYSQKAVGKSWFKKDEKGNLHSKSGKKQYGDILNLPNGAGYKFLREAVTKVIEDLKKLAPRIILLGHIKDTMLEKEGGEFTASDLDLTGKIKRILSAQADAIGYLYRGKNNQNILSFATKDEVICGARPAHLRNKELIISEIDKDENFITHWDRVYID